MEIQGGVFIITGSATGLGARWLGNSLQKAAVW